ncbi:MAG: nodulation protein NfeD [Nitrospiraceae bacterium]|nr:nodulation protein NfeD [Nitrospiraceae bacterium]
MSMFRARYFYFFLLSPAFLLFLTGMPLAHAGKSRPRIMVIDYEGVINPVASQYMEDNIRLANRSDAQALVIELDTPGGLDSSMRSIIKTINGSAVPVVVYVAPNGARAASAGVFITLAANVAAMAPQTNIGAAHPVEIGGKLGKTMEEKVTNDAVAYIKSIAQLRGRNEQWAEKSVRESISSTAGEALNAGVINLIANNLGDLIKKLDGIKVVTAAGPRVINTTGAEITINQMGFRLKALSALSDPNVAYILMLLGFYGIFFEIISPGAILPGVIGAISLITAFYAFQMLPVNYAGVLLILLAIVLFVLDVKLASHGALTAGGIISMVIGSLMLFRSGGPLMQLSIAVIIPAVSVTVLFFFFTVRLVVEARRRTPVTGVEGLKGEAGLAATAINGQGTARVHGELWSAWSEEPIEAGERIEVVSMEGLKLKVKKAQKNKNTESKEAGK